MEGKGKFLSPGFQTLYTVENSEKRGRNKNTQKIIREKRMKRIRQEIEKQKENKENQIKKEQSLKVLEYQHKIELQKFKQQNPPDQQKTVFRRKKKYKKQSDMVKSPKTKSDNPLMFQQLKGSSTLRDLNKDSARRQSSKEQLLDKFSAMRKQLEKAVSNSSPKKMRVNLLEAAGLIKTKKNKKRSKSKKANEKMPLQASQSDSNLIQAKQRIMTKLKEVQDKVQMHIEKSQNQKNQNTYTLPQFAKPISSDVSGIQQVREEEENDVTTLQIKKMYSDVQQEDRIVDIQVQPSHETYAATEIQKIVRGFLTRKKIYEDVKVDERFSDLKRKYGVRQSLGKSKVLSNQESPASQLNLSPQPAPKTHYSDEVDDTRLVFSPISESKVEETEESPIVQRRTHDLPIELASPLNPCGDESSNLNQESPVRTSPIRPLEPFTSNQGRLLSQGDNESFEEVKDFENNFEDLTTSPPVEEAVSPIINRGEDESPCFSPVEPGNAFKRHPRLEEEIKQCSDDQQFIDSPLQVRSIDSNQMLSGDEMQVVKMQPQPANEQEPAKPRNISPIFCDKQISPRAQDSFEMSSLLGMDGERRQSESPRGLRFAHQIRRIDNLSPENDSNIFEKSSFQRFTRTRLHQVNDAENEIEKAIASLNFELEKQVRAKKKRIMEGDHSFRTYKQKKHELERWVHKKKRDIQQTKRQRQQNQNKLMNLMENFLKENSQLKDAVSSITGQHQVRKSHSFEAGGDHILATLDWLGSNSAINSARQLTSSGHSDDEEPGKLDQSKKPFVYQETKEENKQPEVIKVELLTGTKDFNVVHDGFIRASSGESEENEEESLNMELTEDDREEKLQVVQPVIAEIMADLFFEIDKRATDPQISIEQISDEEEDFKKKKGIETTIKQVNDYLDNVFRKIQEQPDLVENVLENIAQPLSRDPLMIMAHLQNSQMPPQQVTEQEAEGEEGQPDPNMMPFQQSVLSVDLYLEIEKERLGESISQMKDSYQESNTQSFVNEIENIHNKAIFDAVNEALDGLRPYGLKGPPLPWSKQAKTLTFKFGKEDALEYLFSKVRVQVLEWAHLSVGAIISPTMGLLQQERIEMFREERMSQMLKQEAEENENLWVDYEYEETQVKLDLADIILDALCLEAVNFLKLM